MGNLKQITAIGDIRGGFKKKISRNALSMQVFSQKNPIERSLQ